jgi:hypothetical protein
MLLLAVSLGGCKAITDVLDVPPPAGVQAADALKSQSGAEAVFGYAKAQFFSAVLGNFSGLLLNSDLFTDEFSASRPSRSRRNDADARHSRGEYDNVGTSPLSTMLLARSSLLIATQGLRQYEPDTAQYKAGEAFALVGYIELLIAEDYCDGITLDRALPKGGVVFGHPLTADSLLHVAMMHFDSALATAHGNALVSNLAHLGIARAHVNLGQFTEAATAAAQVPTGFVYNTELGISSGVSYPNLYALPFVRTSCVDANVSDGEGGNGLNFVSARDPRLLIDSVPGRTCDGGTWYYPVKFGTASTLVPLATGVEARLIEAEAALNAKDTVTWANDLNALRAAAPTTYLHTSAMPALSADSTLGADSVTRVSVHFRERAFWLFGTGTRLPDLRRLIRQYGRDAEAVFPTGPYRGGTMTELPRYDGDVNFILPTLDSGAETENPYYQGCLTSAESA